MAAANPSEAVLLMAYGGPDRLEDVEPFLLDIRGGRPTSPELVEEIRDRYRQIGGGSPLLELTRAQARALEERLEEAAPGRFRVAVGMRHWTPYIRDTVAELVADGVTGLTALCMAPHYSRMSIGAYLARLDEALAAAGGEAVKVRTIDSWGDHPAFLDAVARRVRRGLEQFPAADRDTVHVLFTAHSLPARILADGDPYDHQLRATAAGVAQRLAAQPQGPVTWSFCYQSAGAGAVDWLGPQLEERVEELAQGGTRNLLVATVGFVCDHVEILFDIDIEARGIAEAAGARLERTASLNAEADFIEILADLVLRPAETRS